MEEVELVIKIPEHAYKECKKVKLTEALEGVPFHVMKAIANGTPLPKGHGRLIDADKMALLSDLFCYTKYTGIDEAPYEDATKALEFAPTIIEADNGDGNTWHDVPADEMTLEQARAAVKDLRKKLAEVMSNE